MILGTGIDLVEVDRIASSFARFGERFARRILRPEEFDYCLSHKDPAKHIAARFAALNWLKGTRLTLNARQLAATISRLPHPGLRVRRPPRTKTRFPRISQRLISGAPTARGRKALVGAGTTTQRLSLGTLRV